MWKSFKSKASGWSINPPEQIVHMICKLRNHSNFDKRMPIKTCGWKVNNGMIFFLALLCWETSLGVLAMTNAITC